MCGLVTALLVPTVWFMREWPHVCPTAVFYSLRATQRILTGFFQLILAGGLQVLYDAPWCACSSNLRKDYVSRFRGTESDTQAVTLMDMEV